MSKIFIVNADIAQMETDAIVNATNESLWADTPLANRICMLAGHKKITDACDKLGGCVKGGAVITPGFDLKAKYVIHAVGPIWKGGTHKEAMYLDRVYRNVLQLAVKNNCKTIAFSLISSELFEYPVEECWKIALNAVTDFMRNHEEVYLEVTFCVERDHVRHMGETIYQEMLERHMYGQDAPVKYLFTIHVNVGEPILIGQDQTKRRQILPVTNGILTGRDLEGNPLVGELLPGGSDSQEIRSDGTCKIAGRYGVRLADGRTFYIELNGIRTIVKEYAEKMMKGETVASDLYYFAATPKIEVFDDSLNWMTRHIFFCKAVREKDSVNISYYMVGK